MTEQTFRTYPCPDLRRLRSKLVEEARERPVIRLLVDENEAREQARLLGEALPALSLTEGTVELTP